VDLLGLDHVHRKLQAGLDVNFLQVGVIVGDDRLERMAGMQKLQDVPHGDPRPGDTGFPNANGWVNGDPRATLVLHEE